MPSDGQVPDGWRVVRLGDVAGVTMGQSPPGAMVLDWDGNTCDAEGLPFIQGNAEFGAKFPTPLKWCIRPLKVAEPDDILISVRAPVGQTNRSRETIGIGRGLAAIRFAEFPKNFGWHVINHAKEALERVTQGSTFQAIGGEQLRNLRVPSPPLLEQRAIAGVLDAIDEAKERTEAVIAATERLRESLLHELLTRGVPGWHSEWKEVAGVGTVPACWEVVRLGDVATVRNGTTPSRAKAAYWQNGRMPFVKTGQVNDIFIAIPEEFITHDAVTSAGAVVVSRGSVLIAMIGQGKTRGMAARLGFDAAINQNFAAVFGARKDFGLGFFFAWARQNYSLIRALGQGSNQDALNCALIEGMRVPKPSAAEQQVITNALEALDSSIERATGECEMLQTLKASASDALLTGRLRTISKEGTHV